MPECLRKTSCTCRNPIGYQRMCFSQGVQLKGEMHEYIQEKISHILLSALTIKKKWLQNLAHITDIYNHMIQWNKHLQDSGETFL